MPLLHTRGARVSYSATGSGEAVLLIHGVGATGTAWRPQVKALREHYRVITFDNRGIGASEITEGSLSIEAMADDALSILDAEGVTRCHVVGHSMGGLIATQLALTSPARVRTLALVCTFPDGRSGSRLTRHTLVAGLRTRIGTRSMRRKAFLSLVLSRSIMQSMARDRIAGRMAALFGRDLADQPSIVMQQLRAMSRYDPRWRLRFLASIPTLVISGGEDRIARPEYGRALAEAVPGSRYIELPGAAHAVPIESPMLINRLLAEHMRRAVRQIA
jgi:pimeloyl-ACP methyl ester carboxylesterase